MRRQTNTTEQKRPCRYTDGASAEGETDMFRSYAEAVRKLAEKKVSEKNAQAMPEFALCLPLITLIIGMMITIGQMTYTKQVLQSAAETACRIYVDSDYTESEAKSRALDAAKQMIDEAGFGIEYVPTKKADRIKYEALVSGSNFQMATYRVEGKCKTLFPVKWEGKSIVDSDGYTYLYGQMTMLVERTTD